MIENTVDSHQTVEEESGHQEMSEPVQATLQSMDITGPRIQPIQIEASPSSNDGDCGKEDDVDLQLIEPRFRS